LEKAKTCTAKKNYNDGKVMQRLNEKRWFLNVITLQRAIVNLMIPSKERNSGSELKAMYGNSP
jgi:hypothetical protein